MLDFDEGRLPDADSALAALIERLRASRQDNTRYELCRALSDRATVLRFSNRHREALAELDACEREAGTLGLVASRSILVNVYQQQAKLYMEPDMPVYNADAARERLAKLGELGFKGWWVDETAADLAYQERDWPTAASAYRKLVPEMEREGWLRGVAACRLRIARALLEMGEVESAEAELMPALAFFEHHGPPHLLAGARLYVARLLHARGDTETAWKHVQSALDLVEDGIRHFRALFEQQRFLRDKLEFYLTAFRIGLAASGAEGLWRAWCIAERAKSFYLCQLLANADVELFTDVDAEDIARLHDLESSLDQCEAMLGRARALGNASETQAAEDNLARLSLEKLHLQESLMRANPRWAALRRPPELDLRSELKRVHADWIPVSYFFEPVISGARLHIFWTDKDRIPFHVQTDWNHAQLAELDATRDRLRGSVSPMSRLPRGLLCERVLPDRLLESIDQGSTLLVSPHDHLRNIPIHAFMLGSGDRLIDRYPVQYVPTLALLPVRPVRADSEKILLLGCEHNSFGDRPLPDVPAEINRLDKLWGTHGTVVKKLVPEDGNLEDSKVALKHWREYRLIHVACHGEFPEGRPFDAALRLGAEALRASEFFNTRLSADLISLSACAVGRHSEHHAEMDLVGNEWVGLYIPILYAGAHSMLVSLWNANSEMAAIFMALLHEHLSQGNSPPRAKQLALLAINKKPELLWANWYLVGFPDYQ